MNNKNFLSSIGNKYNFQIKDQEHPNFSNMGKTFPQMNNLEINKNIGNNSPVKLDNNLLSKNQTSNFFNTSNIKDPNPIAMAKLIQEKENLTQALKKEIIKNEEQRNYIQVLKETIESNLFRSGFAEILASSKEYQQFQEFNKGQGKTMADFIVDFIKFKEETNKFKKDLLISNNIITDSKNEIDNLNKKVNDMERKNIQLKNNINKEQSEKEYMFLKDTQNNETINRLNNNIRLLEEENKDLKNQILQYQNINLENDNKMKFTFNKMDSMTESLNKYKDIEVKYNNLLLKYEGLKKENEENLKLKEKFEKLYQTIKNENNFLNDKYKNLETEFNSLGKSVDEVSNKYNNLNTHQDEINNLKSALQDKEKENQELYKKLNILSSEGDIVNIENRNNKQRIKDCMSSIDRLRYEKNDLEEEFSKLHEKYESIMREYNQSQNQNDLLSTNFERLKNEYNILLEEKNKQEIELENNINIKYLKEKEINEIENNYNEKFQKIQKDNIQLNKSLQNALDKIKNLTENNYELKEINEITNKQLREKIENEQILLQENMEFKTEIENLNSKFQENKEQLENKIINYSDLNLNYNKVKSQFNDLQKILKSSSEEKSKLVEKNKKLIEDNKNIEELYQNNLEKLRTISKSNFTEGSLYDFLKETTDEIIKLEKEKNKLNETIKILNMKCFDTAQENQNNIQENNKLKNMLDSFTNNYNKDLSEKEELLKQIENYKLMNYQLQKTLDDYGTELNSKISDLNNISYTRSEIENKNIKLNNDKEFLLTILLRLTKLFSHSNIYDIVNDVFNKKLNEKDSAYQNSMNQKLLQELQRCEDYVNMLKENDLQANYLNLKLNQEIQDLNLKKLRNETNLQTYSIDSPEVGNNNKTKSFNSLNTLKSYNYIQEYGNKNYHNKVFSN